MKKLLCTAAQERVIGLVASRWCLVLLGTAILGEMAVAGFGWCVQNDQELQPYECPQETGCGENCWVWKWSNSDCATGLAWCEDLGHWINAYRYDGTCTQTAAGTCVCSGLVYNGTYTSIWGSDC